MYKNKPQTVDPADIRWEANTSKREADYMAYRAMAFDLMQPRQKSKRLRVLSFPAETWQWEQGLVDVFPSLQLEFVGLERDLKVFKRTRKVAGALSKRFSMPDHPCSFQDYALAQRSRRGFDLVYLDWMGTWSKEKKSDLAAMFSRNLLAVGGVLLMTVSIRRGRPESMDELADLSYDLPLAFYDARGEDKYTSNLKVRGIPHWVQNYAEENHDVRMRPIMASVYYSNTGLSTHVQPQLQILMLRES